MIIHALLLAATISAGSPETAETCGRCHRSIYEAWKLSAHARAMESRLFQDVLELAESDFGAGTRKLCLSCHAPTAVRTGDLQLARKVSWEGVTCDYCHSIQDVALGGTNPVAKVAFTLVKSGPLKDAASTAHGTSFSAVHTSALACAPCHDYRNALGFPVLTTFTEWKNSRAGKEGRACQTCHMYAVGGNVVDPHIKRSREAKINVHRMPGSHSVEQLTKTISANLSTVREGGQLKVSVEITNRGAGHSVPTGSPLRELTLEVSADSFDGKHFQGSRSYRRVVADQQGKPIAREHEAFIKGAKVLSDTRLSPDEKRTEVFTFPVPQGTQAQVKAAFWYFYSPMARTEDQKRITFLTLRRLVK